MMKKGAAVSVVLLIMKVIQDIAVISGDGPFGEGVLMLRFWNTFMVFAIAFASCLYTFTLIVFKN